MLNGILSMHRMLYLEYVKRHEVLRQTLMIGCALNSGKSSTALKEGPKTESEWSDVAENEDGSEKWTELSTVIVPLPSTAVEDVSETDTDYPMQSLPASPPCENTNYDLSLAGLSRRKLAESQNASENGLFTEEQALNFLSP